jgi:hypothetical protein
MVTLQTIESLLPLCILFVTLAAMLSLLQRVVGDIRSRAGNGDFSELHLRSPGESIWSKLDRTSQEITAYGVAVFAVPLTLCTVYLSYLFFSRGSGEWTETVYLSCLCVGFLIFGGNKLRRLVNKRRHLQRVYAGLQVVAQEISQLMLSGHRVFHDFPTGQFNIDHIIVGPSGVYTVQARIPSDLEPANGRGDPTVYLDGQVLRFHKRVDTRTVSNAAFQAAWLANWLLTTSGIALRVQALLTVPGWKIQTLRQGEVLAADPHQVGRMVIRHPAGRLTDKVTRQIWTQIEDKCRAPAAQANPAGH